MGFVLQGPGGLENLTASFDWYDIEITDAIAPLNSLFAYQQCFNANGSSNPTLSYTGNQYCPLILRNVTSGERSSVDAPFTWLTRATGGSYFAAYKGQDAMAALEALLAREFADLDFDRRVRDTHQHNPVATVEELAAALESPPARVAASLSRLGRRGLLTVETVASGVH